MPTFNGTARTTLTPARNQIGPVLGNEDIAYGNGGNDTLRGNAGNDVLDGGDGVDRLRRRSSRFAVRRWRP